MLTGELTKGTKHVENKQGMCTGQCMDEGISGSIFEACNLSSNSGNTSLMLITVNKKIMKNWSLIIDNIMTGIVLQE